MTTSPAPDRSGARPRRGSGDTYAALREAIVGGRFQPNERLVEAELVQLLQAGRSAVRAALVRLDQEGLVVREHNRGARVRLISGREAVEIEHVRIALERMLARTAATRVTDTDLLDLEDTLAEMRRRVEAGDPLGYSALNSTLHQRIWAIADQQLAVELLSTLKSQSIRFQYGTILQPGRAETSLAEHVAIVAALTARDPDAAEAAMGDHLGKVVATLERAIAAHGHQAAWLHPAIADPG